MSKRKKVSKKFEKVLEKEPLNEEEFPIQLSKKRVLKKLETKVLKQEKVSDVEFEETEHELSEDTRETQEGLGIEEEEKKGEKAYPEIEEAEKDPDEEEEE